MKLYINSFRVWYPVSSETKSIEQSLHDYTSDETTNVVWPTIDFVPPMQKRRLSKFAKIALYVANKTVDSNKNNLPIVFSSRHGDLHRTSELLESLAHEQALSPTAFGLSVHNAIPSLYSILTGNKQAITAIGKDTFFMALIDTYARLTSGVCEEVLLIHADQDLPNAYSVYQDELQIPHAVAMLISKESNQGSLDDDLIDQVEPCFITCDFNSINADVQNKNNLPAALAFAQWIKSDNAEFNLNSQNYHWQFNKHA